MARCEDCDNFERDSRYNDRGRCKELRKDVRADDRACSNFD